MELEQPTVQWSALPKVVQDYCSDNVAIIEIWVDWTEENSSWKVFTEMEVGEHGVTRIIRAVRTQGDVFARILCQAFSEMFQGRPVQLNRPDAEQSSGPIHALYLSARISLEAAACRQIELLGYSSRAMTEIGSPDIATWCSKELERVWRRDHPPRTSLRSFCVSNPKIQLDKAPRGIILASVERAFVAQHYIRISAQVTKLLAPFSHTPIVEALEHFVQNAVIEAKNAVSSPSRVQPHRNSLESAHNTLVRLLHQLSEIGAPEYTRESNGSSYSQLLEAYTSTL